MPPAPVPIETLLAHREWVRAVALAVVRDPNAADDVEQETWLAALRTPLLPGRYRVDVDVTETITLHGEIAVPAENAPEALDVVLR